MIRRRPSHSRRALARRYHVPDAALRDRLARDGYVIVPLLDDGQLEQVRAIRRVHGAAPDDPRTGFFIDTSSAAVAYKQAVSDALRGVVGPALRRYLPEHRQLGVAHVVKWPGPDGVVVAHRDPTFVDEDHFRSIMLWCPLTDVIDADGALWVVPGSHRESASLRVHQSPANLVEGVETMPGGRARPLELRAGEAVLYDHALVHLSGANSGPHERVAVAGPLVPISADARYALAVDGADVQVVRIDESLFVEHQLCDLDVERVLADYAPIGDPARSVAIP